MATKLYVEPLMVLFDYVFTTERHHRVFELWIPIILGVLGGGYVFFYDIDTYSIVEHVQEIITTLLGFTLAAMAIFVAGGDKCEQTKAYMTEKTIHGKKCSLYDLMILNYSYQVLVEFILCIAYIVGLCFPCLVPEWMAALLNILYVVVALNVCLSTLRGVTDLYWIFVAKERT